MIEKNEVKDKKEIFEEKQQELFDRFFTLKKELSKTKKETEKYEEVLDLLNYTAGNIIESNKGLIIKIAYKRMVEGVEFEDLIQEGRKAMYEALLRYDHTKDNKFTTYAYKFIDGSLNNYLRDNSRIIRVQWLANDNYRLYAKCLDDFKNKYNKYPLDSELIVFMNSDEKTRYMVSSNKNDRRNWDKEKLERMKMISDQASLSSINDTFGGDNDTELFEVIEDKTIKRPDKIAEENDRRIRIRQKLDQLFDYYKDNIDTKIIIDVLKLRFGIYDDDLKIRIIKTIKKMGKEAFGVIKETGLTLEQISYIYDITKESARIYESVGLRQSQILAGTIPEVEIKEEHRFPFLNRDLDIRPKQLKDVEFVDYDSDIININSKNAYISAKKQGETDLVILDHINDREITYHIKVTPKYKDNEYNRKKAKKLALRKEAKHE